MTKNTSNARLSDVQLLLLSAAINRPDGSLLPPSAALGGGLKERVRKAITGLMRRGLAEERDTTQADQVWREDGDRHIGLVITDAGRAAIAAEGECGGPDDTPAPVLPTPTPDDNTNGQSAGPEPDSAPAAVSAADPKAESKIASVITLLERPEGATLLELVDATDWLPHTIRAAMTGLRHKGYAIERSSRDDTTFWYIAAGA